MKRKGARDIPDFSSKRTKELHGTNPSPRQAPSPVPRERVIKPPSTSAKSGRRGS